MRIVYALALVTLVGCQGLAPFIDEVGAAASGVEVGGPGPDTEGEQVVDAIALATPALPPVVGWALSGLLSGAAVYSHMKKKGEIQ